MSLTASPLADAPYAATIHAVELDDFGHSFRAVAPGLFTCRIDVACLEALDDRDELRAVLRAGRGRQRRVDQRGSTLEMPWGDRR
jgi:methionine synthase I (cobalamin-dependent)